MDRPISPHDTLRHEVGARAAGAMNLENWTDDEAALAIVERCGDAYAGAPTPVVLAAWGVRPWPATD